MLGIGTSVLLRLLVADDAARTRRARKVVEASLARGEPVLVSLLVMIEADEGWAVRRRRPLMPRPRAYRDSAPCSEAMPVQLAFSLGALLGHSYICTQAVVRGSTGLVLFSGAAGAAALPAAGPASCLSLSAAAREPAVSRPRPSALQCSAGSVAAALAMA